LLAAWRNESDGRSLYDHFQSGPWHRLVTVLADEERETPATIRLAAATSNGRKHLKIIGSSNRTLLTYLSADLDRMRFLERCTPPPDDAAVPTRGEVIRQLALLTLTENESLLMDRGLKTRRQVLEETFWYKFAYHCFREFGSDGCTLHPAIDESSGAFMVTGTSPKNEDVFKIEIPRKRVKRLLLECNGLLSNQHELAIDPIPLDAIFDVKLTSKLQLEIRPLLRLIQKNGEAKFFQREDLKRFQYGDLYYIKELKLLAEDRYPEPPPESFAEPVKTVIKKSQVPSFLDQHAADLESAAFQVDESIRRLKILKTFDRLEITPRTLERDWLWLSISYGAGNQCIALAEILKARREKQRYVATDEGWVDCNSPQFGILGLLQIDRSASEPDANEQTIRLRRIDLLRLAAAERERFQIDGDSRRTEELKNFLDLKSAVPLPDFKKQLTPLRGYQVRDAE